MASGTPGEALPTLEPEQAHRDAIESGLVVRSEHPLNCEAPLAALTGAVIVPNTPFYKRNHFHIPILDQEKYRLTIGGLVQRPLTLSLQELRAMPSRSMPVTLECAGNGRVFFDPPIGGEKWQFGAVSTAEWTGIPLAELLRQANPAKSAREAVFRGADAGAVEGRSAPVRFERSLRLTDPCLDDALLAYSMNGDPLPIAHGFPLRLIVPSWYAVTSVKWLTEIELIDRPFDGFFQADRYWYRCSREGQVATEPVTLQRVRSLITYPSNDQEVQRAEIAIRGMAWSGAAPVSKVEVSIDAGGWQEARLLDQPLRGAWRRWELIVGRDQPGALTVRSRATDQEGNTQPDRAEWNSLGYGNNSVQIVTIRAV